MRTCSIQGCARKHCARGWCRPHYIRWWNYGDPEREPEFHIPQVGACSVEGCDIPKRAGGFCHNHYALARKYGTPSRVRPMGRPPCTVGDCWRRQNARGMCMTHYLAWLAAQPGPECATPACEQRAVSNGHCISHDKMRRNRERRARLRGGTGNHTESEWQAKVALYGGRCAYCGAKGKMTRDHVVPVFRGGGDGIDNIVPACPRCNHGKRAKLVTEWLPLGVQPALRF